MLKVQLLSTNHRSVLSTNAVAMSCLFLQTLTVTNAHASNLPNLRKSHKNHLQTTEHQGMMRMSWCCQQSDLQENHEYV